MKNDSSTKAIQTLRYAQIFAGWGMLVGRLFALIDHTWFMAAISVPGCSVG